MANTSIWASVDAPQALYPELTHDLKVDVLIIGGGITGLTTALQLYEAGKNVAVVEADFVGHGTTGNSTGNLYVTTQPHYQTIVKKFDEETARQVAQSRQFAIDFIEKNVAAKDIVCHFARRPFFLYTNRKDKVDFLDTEIETFHKIGINGHEVHSVPFDLPYKKAFCLENQARLNPLKYVKGLANYLHNNNVKIFEKTQVFSFSENKTGCMVKTKNANISANQVVIATHTPIGINMKQLCTAPYRSYVIALHLKNPTYPECQFANMDGMVHTIATHGIQTDLPEIVLIAGSHHKTGQNKKGISHFNQLKEFANKHFDIERISHQWSAQHYQSVDKIPYIGLASHFSKHTFLATGFFADGLVYGTLAGIMLSDIILTKKNVFEEVYKSTRFTPVASAPDFFKENGNVFFKYLQDYPYLFTQSIEHIKSGEGKVVEKDGEKYAVSRDENNKVCVVSAVCTHMKCIVNWNNEEKTWDCPCHGSRFTPQGKVIEGPAIHDLESKKL